jgi:site-specific recombinase XerD
MGAKADIYHQEAVFDRTLERYLAKLYPEDRGDIERFINDLTAQGYSAARVNKYLASLVSIKRIMGKPFRKASVEDVKHFAARLERSDYKAWTRHDLKVILRRYMRWLGKDDTVNWMKVTLPKNGTLPEEVLTEEEIKRMAEAAITTRDKAFVLALYESGARIGEFLPLKLKHVSFDKYGAVLRLSGKTGDRRVRLVFSALPLQRWIEEHPGKDDPEAYLWCQIPGPYHPPRKVKNKHLSYGFVCRLLRELAEKAGIKKKVNPHAFRHARATFMARHLKEPEMREFFGWGKDSEMPSIYVHLSGRDVDNSVLGIYGIKEATKNQEPVLKVEPCPRCQEPNDPASKFCRRCGLPLGKQAYSVDRLEELVIDFIKVMVETFPEAREKFREVVKKKGAEGLFT